jgi:hypothetical protein
MRGIVPVVAAFAVATLAGCAGVMGEAAPKRGFVAQAADAPPPQAATEGRLLIRSASLEVEVGDPAAAAAKAVDFVTKTGGFVERSTSSEEGAVELTLRVPEEQLDGTIRTFEALGDVVRKSVSATDVTDEVVDLDARMKNLVATRDNFRRLLDKAASVQDVVAVEKELSRVQGEIDAMEARLKSLRGRISLSEVGLELRKARILGPLGYVGRGVYWLVSKLFVISG